uniref:Uncharacterized protein n=1 Tax=viral metagenome TaxID=1070528 RepID=A0A2V0RIZ3_9ZZZZ
MSIFHEYKKAFEFGYGIGHDKLGPALSKVLAADDEMDTKAENMRIRMEGQLHLVSLRNEQTRQLCAGRMPGLEEHIGCSVQGYPPGYIIKAFETTYTLSQLSTSNNVDDKRIVFVKNIDEVGHLMSAQYFSGNNPLTNVAKQNTYPGLTEARRPQHGDYFLAANLRARENFSQNVNAGKFTIAFLPLRSNELNQTDGIYDVLTSAGVEAEMMAHPDSGAISFNSSTSVAVATPHIYPIMMTKDPAATASGASALNTLVANDPKTRMALVISAAGYNNAGGVVNVQVTLKEYYLSPPSSSGLVSTTSASNKIHMDELERLCFNPINMI